LATTLSEMNSASLESSCFQLSATLGTLLLDAAVPCKCSGKCPFQKILSTAYATAML
jgi:hypothetical protein